jgi:ATP-dependent helicase HepA
MAKAACFVANSSEKTNRMDPDSWTRGQRWVSDGEPELGLGKILTRGNGRIQIEFPAAGESRTYATESAPLRRVKFMPGDRIQDHTGKEMIITSVREHRNLRIYQTDDGEIPEENLADTMSFSKPEERLFGGKLDDHADFDLRGEALRRRAEIRASPIQGLAGARMDLIPHQLFIADEVTRRPQPRVLLADEVGLGKTIEACLILHRLILTGRADRVLILVPEPLIHQWFVELLRRFQLSFSLFVEERCEAIEQGEPGCNPYLDSQWVLASVDHLAANPLRAAQAREAGWDILVVDEAHHLEWSPEASSPAYQLVESLAETIHGLLLLTATPEQLGPEGHFARLKLLDPDRYRELEVFRLETLQYERVADAVDLLSTGATPDQSVRTIIRGRPRLEQRFADLIDGRPLARERLIADLLDSFGLGRVMFRNTRAMLGGFPTREPRIVPTTDKLSWLIDLLEEYEGEKILVITKTRTAAEEILEHLLTATGVAGAVFHEDLTLLQRDRNAAFFAEPEGARILVCSEIGSEGRNFQFARHLVLYDLPNDVDLLEQRIGRLDRIGQRGTIHIHVPYLPSSTEEVRVRWLNEGLDAFRTSLRGAAEIQRDLAIELEEALNDHTLLDSLIEHTRALKKQVSERLARGQDRLLALSSHRVDQSEYLVTRIHQWDQDHDFEEFILRLFEFSGLHIDDLGDRRYFLRPSGLKSDTFSALPQDGMTVTLNRQRALEHELETFLTLDHPMVRGALDLMLASPNGNATFGVWDSPGEKTILLESWLVIECIAPAALHVDRFLPQTPLRIIVDHMGNDHTGEDFYAHPPLRKGDPGSLLRNEKLKRTILPSMLEKTRAIGYQKSQEVIQDALQRMHRETSLEITRLRDLAEVNDHIKPAEISMLEARQSELASVISNSRLRLDAVRIIWKAPILNIH